MREECDSLVSVSERVGLGQSEFVGGSLARSVSRA
jgi:hypothetical protein